MIKKKPGLEIKRQRGGQKADGKKPMLVRFDAEMTARIEAAAKRLGLSRPGFVALSTAEKLERLDDQGR
jgi:hypothetical protein